MSREMFSSEITSAHQMSFMSGGRNNEEMLSRRTKVNLSHTTEEFSVSFSLFISNIFALEIYSLFSLGLSITRF